MHIDMFNSNNEIDKVSWRNANIPTPPVLVYILIQELDGKQPWQHV